MKNILILFTMVFAYTLYAQEANTLELDQNPNAVAAYNKYAKNADNNVLKQGTTVQETYVAIDPMEEKRIRKKRSKEHRAMRSLWRHEERMERAKNTQHVISRSYYRSSFNNILRNPFYGSIGLGYILGRNRF